MPRRVLVGPVSLTRLTVGPVSLTRAPYGVTCTLQGPRVDKLPTLTVRTVTVSTATVSTATVSTVTVSTGSKLARILQRVIVRVPLAR